MTDPIGDALAIALEEIEEHGKEERYSDPTVAARIASVRAAMQDLQLYLDALLN